MTIKVRGQEEVRRYLRALPAEIEKMLRAGGRVGGRVVADVAKRLSRSDVVSKNVVVEVTVAEGRIRVWITVKPGWARSVGVWLEYGTSAHFISVDAEQSGGRSAARVNRLGKDGVLVINGKPAGKTVWHPGAQPHPFLRPAIDIRRADTIASVQAYIRSKIRAGRIVDSSGEGEG